VPNSKHRRKGKTRKPANLKTAPSLWSRAYREEYERRQDALLLERLRKKYGGDDWDDWTEEQIDEAIEEHNRENPSP
jgi:hypothetical protein